MAKFSSLITKGLYRSALVFAVCSALAMVSILTVIVASVVLRKFFNSPLFFTEELVGLLMSVTLFLALPMACLKGQNIRVTLLLDTLRQRFPALAMPLFWFGMAVGIGFCGWIFWEAIPWMEFAIKRELKSETARILLYPMMSVVPISMGLCCIIYFSKLTGILQAGER